MANRCPNSKVIGKEMLKGYELEFRGVATIVPKENAEVPVLIWEIDGRDEHSLDKYEGFPNYYRKELFEIDVNGRKERVYGISDEQRSHFAAYELLLQRYKAGL